MKTRLLIVILLSYSIASIAQAKKDSLSFDYHVRETSGWVFYAPDSPVIQLDAVNRGLLDATSMLRLEVTTDCNQDLFSLSQSITLHKGDSVQVDFSFHLSNPGFYRCVLSEGTQVIRKFNIGYEPENIVSLSDHPSDLKEFWRKAKAELAQVDPDYWLKQISDSTNRKRRLYEVTMKSLGGVEISGYYSVPIRKGKFPAIISYMGYGSKPWIPGGNNDYAEFVLSVRGQGLQQPNNNYGDWITFRLDSKENYYYRGAFMDLVRAIDFVSSRAEVNANTIFAEGGSQGGAFALAAAALDDRLCGIAPSIPFLSDFPDYFKIVPWPATPIFKKQKEMGLSDAKLYETLSYFDIKNIALWIKCPVIMGVGLQDEICPPHTNFAGYNCISSLKEYHIYPLNGHNTPVEWHHKKMDFFNKLFRLYAD